MSRIFVSRFCRVGILQALENRRVLTVYRKQVYPFAAHRLGHQSAAGDKAFFVGQCQIFAALNGGKGGCEPAIPTTALRRISAPGIAASSASPFAPSRSTGGWENPSSSLFTRCAAAGSTTATALGENSLICPAAAGRHCGLPQVRTPHNPAPGLHQGSGCRWNGRSQQCNAFGHIAQTPFYREIKGIHREISETNGITNNTLSNLSSMPPCPGKIDP